MAEAAFGARVTSFYYRDINGIKVSTGLAMGVIEINTPRYKVHKRRTIGATRTKTEILVKSVTAFPSLKLTSSAISH